MDILKRYRVPTGDILVVSGERGDLEMLSLYDYGRDVNVKADFLGLTRDIRRVKHSALLPLEDKWVITVSTQYGCSMGCSFCDVPKVGPGVNATLRDLRYQINTGLRLHPEVKASKHLNVHFARMGEPTWNPDVLLAARWIKDCVDPIYAAHPVVSTMMPKHNTQLRAFLREWMHIKNQVFQGNAGLQLSVNSTSEAERAEMFRGSACILEGVAAMMEGLVPAGRKVTLNFAVAAWEIDADVLLQYFDPRHYVIKLTPMHKTRAAVQSGIKTQGDYTSFYPYQRHEENLKRAGYDVLVFIASEEEDLGRITCGNAILSGTEPACEFSVE